MTERLRRPHFGEDAPETEDGDGETRAAGRDPTVVSAHDSSAGGIDFDELGQPRWRWVTEHPGAGSLTTEDTFNYLKALDSDALSLSDDAGAAGGNPPESGYDPYDTARIDVRGRFGRRR